MPALRGSTPLHHIDSVHLTGQDSSHHQAEEEDSPSGSFDETVVDAATDQEKGEGEGAKRRRLKRQTTVEWETTSAETREWKDDIVLFDNKRDVSAESCS